MDTVKKPAHGSQEWLELRHRDKYGRVRFGASEAPVLMGVSPWANLGDLTIAKLGKVGPTPPSPAMTRGNVLEPGLISWAAELLGEKVVTPDVMYTVGRMIATLDGLSESGIIVECKTTTSHSSDDDLPEEYYWQVVAQFACCPFAQEAVVVVLDKRMRLGHWRVLRNQEDCDRLLDRADQIGDVLDRGETPAEVEFTEKQAQIRFTGPAGEVELGKRGLFLVEEAQAWAQARKDAERNEQACRDELSHLLGAYEYGTFDGQRIVSFKARKGQSKVDWKQLAADHPDLLNRYRVKGAPTRVLRIGQTPDKMEDSE